MNSFKTEMYNDKNKRVEYYRKATNNIMRKYSLTVSFSECFIETLNSILQALKTNQAFSSEIASNDFCVKHEAQLYSDLITGWIEVMQKIENGTYYMAGC